MAEKTEIDQQPMGKAEKLAQEYIENLPKDAPDPFFVLGLRHGARMLDEQAVNCNIHAAMQELVSLGGTLSHLRSSIFTKDPAVSIVGVSDNARRLVQQIGNQVAETLIENCRCRD